MKTLIAILLFVSSLSASVLQSSQIVPAAASTSNVLTISASTAGSTFVIGYGTDAPNSGITSITCTGCTCTQRISNRNVADVDRAIVESWDCTGATAGTTSVTVNYDFSKPALGFLELSNGNGYDISGHDEGDFASQTTWNVSLTTTGADDALVGMGCTSTSPATSTSGFTDDVDAEGSGNLVCIWAYKTVTGAAGSYSWAGTSSGFARKSMVLVAYKTTASFVVKTRLSGKMHVSGKVHIY
jgi:hypothetical protein